MSTSHATILRKLHSGTAKYLTIRSTDQSTRKLHLAFYTAIADRHHDAEQALRHFQAATRPPLACQLMQDRPDHIAALSNAFQSFHD
eukprot:7103616-Pyramimonas_sp.AAC.1